MTSAGVGVGSLFLIRTLLRAADDQDPILDALSEKSTVGSQVTTPANVGCAVMRSTQRASVSREHRVTFPHAGPGGSSVCRSHSLPRGAKAGRRMMDRRNVRQTDARGWDHSTRRAGRDLR